MGVINLHAGGQAKVERGIIFSNIKKIQTISNNIFAKSYKSNPAMEKLIIAMLSRKSSETAIHPTTLFYFQRLNKS